MPVCVHARENLALRVVVFDTRPPFPLFAPRSQAADTQDALLEQRRLVSSATGGLSSIAAKFPTLNRIMTSIHSRKLRENAVLGVTIAACVSFTLWYMFG